MRLMRLLRLTGMRLARMHLAGILCGTLGGLASVAGEAQGQCDGASDPSRPSQGFYLPSLQSLIMMPLSQAGDRLEAKLEAKSTSHRYASKPISAGSARLQCDAWMEPTRFQMPSGVRPSYGLQELALGPSSPIDATAVTEVNGDCSALSTGALSTGALHPEDNSETPMDKAIDKDEQLAQELNEPVRFSSPESSALLRSELRSGPVSKLGKQHVESEVSAIRLASGTSSVRVTGGSESRAGEIRDRHQQRQRAENFGQKPHR
ncbi:MAG: hypothetical protein NTV29_12495 [Planctomycetota bacterium]|nr:hypothetical protein [Planctomycetota bacterium]